MVPNHARYQLRHTPQTRFLTMRMQEQYSILVAACQAPSLPVTTVAKPHHEEIPARPQAMEQPTT